MTPAVQALQGASIPFQLLQYSLAPAHGKAEQRHSGPRAIGLEAALALDLAPEQVFKTLIAELNTSALVVAIIPVAAKLNMKCLARAAGVKSASLARTQRAERVTGYVSGGISPVGQKQKLPTFLALEAQALTELYVSAGRRGLELCLRPADLVQMTDAQLCPLV